MTPTQILILVLGGLAALGLSFYTYLRREPAGRGRRLLASLRFLALLLIILLLIDPHVRTGAVQRAGGTRVVLDASLSMTLRQGGSDAWQRGVAEAQKVANGQPVLLAGTDVRTVRTDSLKTLQPYAGETRLLPALQSAAEAGAERVVLITDGAITDPQEVANWLPTLGVALQVRNVGGTIPTNRAISEVAAPAWAEAGKPLTMHLGVSASGNAPGKTSVVVRQNGTEVARTQLDVTSTTGVTATDITFTAKGPAEGGLVRYDVAFETPDSIPDDDMRSVYVFVSDKPAGVAIVSFDPDWEPRFLHPVLADALGLPVRTFLRVPSGMYFRGGNGADAGQRAQEGEVQRAVAQADLVVFHGMSASAPAWAQKASADARRLLVFPDEAGIQTPVKTGTPSEADWYVSPEVPASPIAPLLAGIDIANLPPLNSLAAMPARDNGWTPLTVGRTPRGGSLPLAWAEQDGPRRWAVALAQGYWRWAFRGGTSKDAYARLWGALAGWLVQDETQVAAAAIRPVERAVARGNSIRWLAPGFTADSLTIELRDAQGRTARTTATVQSGDTAVTAAPAPGHYTYDARAFSGGKEIARANGPITIESYSPEFIRRPVNLAELQNGKTALARGPRGAGRALHTIPWLYVLLIALLSAEWILRRRWGLR